MFAVVNQADSPLLYLANVTNENGDIVNEELKTPEKGKASSAGSILKYGLQICFPHWKISFSRLSLWPWEALTIG